MKEEFLIDLKNKKNKAFTFHKLYFTTGLLSNEEIIEFIIISEKLLKRSDNNIETLLIILD